MIVSYQLFWQSTMIMCTIEICGSTSFFNMILKINKQENFHETQAAQTADDFLGQSPSHTKKYCCHEALMALMDVKWQFNINEICNLEIK